MYAFFCQKYIIITTYIDNRFSNRSDFCNFICASESSLILFDNLMMNLCDDKIHTVTAASGPQIAVISKQLSKLW